MRHLLFSVSFIILTTHLATAQTQYPKAELFGGYSYFRANPEEFNLNGWNASVTANVTDWLGVEGDFSGHYGSPAVFGFEIPYVDVNSHTFMAGPKITYRSPKIAPFAHVLIGASRAATSAFGFTVSNTALATAVGGGLDVKVSDAIAVRLLQLDYVMTRHQTAPQIFFSGFRDQQNNLRFSAGLVFKLGK